MPVNDETRWRVPQANLDALDVPAGTSVFEATEGGRAVDAVVYNVRTGHVLIGRAMTHQSLIDRYTPWTSIDDYVRGDLFPRFRRLELDTCRAAVPVDRRGVPDSVSQAFRCLFDALGAFRAMGFHGGWSVLIDGEEIGG